MKPYPYPGWGTAIGEAIKTLPVKPFKAVRPVKRPLIIITDGENHKGIRREAKSRQRGYYHLHHWPGSPHGELILLRDTTGKYLLPQRPGRKVVKSASTKNPPADCQLGGNYLWGSGRPSAWKSYMKTD